MVRKIVLLSAALILCGTGAIAQTQNSPLTKPNLFPNKQTANGLSSSPLPPPDVSSTVMSHALNATPGYASWPPSYPGATSGPGYQSTQPTYLSAPAVTAPQFQNTSQPSSSGGTTSPNGAGATPGGPAMSSGATGTSSSAGASSGAAGAASANCVPGETLPAC